MLIIIAFTLLVLFVSSAIFFYCAFKLPKSRDASFFEGILIGHRGCRDFEDIKFDCQENTLSACEYALNRGAKGIEFDIMLSKDEVPFVFHDTNRMSRVCKPLGIAEEECIYNLTSQEIRLFKYNKGDHNERIPSLEEMIHKITEIYSGTKMMIESKEFKGSYKMAYEISKVFKKYNLHKTCVVGSFNPVALYHVRKVDPEIVTLLLIRSDLLQSWVNDREERDLPQNLTWLPKILDLFNSLYLLPILDYLLFKCKTTWLPSFLGVGVVGFHGKLIYDGVIDPNYFQNRGYTINVWVVNRKEHKLLLESNDKISITTDVLFDS